MPDAIVILVPIAVVALAAIALRGSSNSARPSAPPGAVSAPPRIRTSTRATASTRAADLGSDEDFYRDEDEFAVFADEDE